MFRIRSVLSKFTNFYDLLLFPKILNMKVYIFAQRQPILAYTFLL